MPSWRTGSGVYSFFTVTGETTFYQNTAGYMSGILVQPGMGAAQREAPSGKLFDGSIPDDADPIPGTAAGTFGFASSGQGLRRVAGALPAAFGFTGTAAGTVDTPVTQVDGTAQASLGGAGSAAGVTTKTGTATATLGGVATGAGISTTVGTATATLGGTSTAIGLRRVISSAAALLGPTTTATGVRRVAGTAAADLAGTAPATGQASKPPGPGRIQRSNQSPGNISQRDEPASPGNVS